MAPKLESRRPSRHVDDLITLLDQVTHPREVELIADSLAESGDARAIRPLLVHLGDSQVQGDADAEDAVCRALMTLGVMCSYGDHSFRLRPRKTLRPETAETVREVSGSIPWQYFGTVGI